MGISNNLICEDKEIKCSAVNFVAINADIDFQLCSQFPTLTVFCMLRPRGGSDFRYTPLEMDALLADLQALRAAGSDGFVFGALNADRTVNEQQARCVVAAAGPLPVTFHRAFDVTEPSQLSENWRAVVRAGCQRLLTSGLSATAEKGVAVIRQLVQLSAGTGVTVLAGSGISVANAARVLTETGCRELHGSGREPVPVVTESSSAVNGIDFGRTIHTDEDVVRQLVEIELYAVRHGSE